MTRLKQVYKITYPNEKIYVGSDLTGTLTYFGSPSAKAKEQIVADLAAHRLDLTVRKQILWESEIGTYVKSPEQTVRGVDRDLPTWWGPGLTR